MIPTQQALPSKTGTRIDVSEDESELELELDADALTETYALLLDGVTNTHTEL